VTTAPGPAGATRPCDLLLDGLALALTEGRAAAEPVLQRATAAFAGEVSAEELLRWGWLATAAAGYLWDLDRCFAVATRGVQIVRDLGALEVLPVAVNVMSQATVLRGGFATAALLVAEADAVIEATGTPVAPYGALTLAGFRGDAAYASTLIDATIRDATASGQGIAVQYAHWCRALVMNGRGRYEDALAAATAATDDPHEMFAATWALSELIEAATRTQNPELAAHALARLDEQTRDSTAGWGLGLATRGRALLADGDGADGLYRRAIEHLSHSLLRPELARAHLLYGEWLRRENRRVDAREQLRTAHDMLATIGMEAFAERARNELEATGEKVRKRTVETRDDLTAQERQIARLARDGMSNPEIGARLFLSPRTVEWHLHNVFAKLDIRSRRDLSKAMPSSNPHLAASRAGHRTAAA
jgi:ATP/maltotriose-dependent transcriptional regulator MalT